MNDPQWRDIPGCPGYQVACNGQIRRTKRAQGTKPGRLVSYRLTQAGYRRFEASNNGIRARHYVHRCVALAFIGPPPSDKHEVAHYDGNKLNNHVDNLRWATRLENAADNRRLGVIRFGKLRAKPHLTDGDVIQIRQCRERGESLNRIAKKFGTTYTNIRFICLRRTWKHVA
jgi:HNH endonuclease